MTTCKGLGRLLGHSFSGRFSTYSLETKDANGATYSESRSTYEGEVCSWCGHFLVPTRARRPELEFDTSAGSVPELRAAS